METNFNDLPVEIKRLIFKSKPFKKERTKNRRERRHWKEAYNRMIQGVFQREFGWDTGGEWDNDAHEDWLEDVFDDVQIWNRRTR